MKELSVEEKAKRYDVAFERAKEMIKSMTNIGGVAKVDDIQYLFPELKESEDERINEWLINLVKSHIEWLEDRIREQLSNGQVYGGELVKAKNSLAWLEKQREQSTNHKTMIVGFKCKKDWHGIGDYCCGKIYNGYPCEKEQKGYDIYDDNHIPTFCDEDFIDEYFIIIEEKQGDKSTDEEMKEALRTEYEKGRADVIAEMQKPTWSEEDERHFSWLIEHLGQSAGLYDNLIDWLKSLKDRVQPKVELTQLDKNILEAAIAFVEQNNHFNCWRGVDKHTVLSALHSLKPQNTWKPSYEQMNNK